MEKEILKIVKHNSKKLDEHEEIFTAIQQSILENSRKIDRNEKTIKELRDDMTTGFDQIIGKLDFLIQENPMSHHALNRHEGRISRLESLHGII